MVSTVRITINDSGMIKKLAKLNSSVFQEAEASTRQITTEGVNVAREFAPKGKTLRMSKMIIPRFFKTKSGFRGMIVAQNPTKNPPASYRTTTNSKYPNGVFNLTYWAHTSVKARTHFKTGKYNFMDLTREQLQRRKKSYGDLMKQKIIERNK